MKMEKHLRLETLDKELKSLEKLEKRIRDLDHKANEIRDIAYELKAMCLERMKQIEEESRDEVKEKLEEYEDDLTWEDYKKILEVL